MEGLCNSKHPSGLLVCRLIMSLAEGFYSQFLFCLPSFANLPNIHFSDHISATDIPTAWRGLFTNNKCCFVCQLGFHPLMLWMRQWYLNHWDFYNFQVRSSWCYLTKKTFFFSAEVCKFEVYVIHYLFCNVQPKLYLQYFKVPYFLNERPGCLFKILTAYSKLRKGLL